MREKINIFQIVGIIFIIGSLIFFFFLEINEQKHAQEVKEIVEKIELRIPERSTGNLLNHSDFQMPVLQIDGNDFLGLLEVPMQGVKLPIYNQWDKNKVYSYPCRFLGSVYDAPMIIGGKDANGQMDFLSKLDLGDLIVVTDMTGAEYSYHIERIDRAKSADVEKLYSKENDLTLFVREKYNMNYIIVRCKNAYQSLM